ncbi:hypothetical protein QCA50_013738 [Cerrena zonata]|uniref:Uncharacterized protein n=1 Tax=Cerrena zonata TaxID=2478898 RepID=A0AAW0FQC2_9APHY
MASIHSAARVLRAVSPAIRVGQRQIPNVVLRRCLHQTPVALKKKQKAVSDTDDLFASDDLFNEEEEDLFSATADTNEATQSNSAAQPGSSRSTLSPEERLRRFNKLHKYVSDRTGIKPKSTDGSQVRKTAWLHLFSLATTKEQLESVAELFPKWRESRRPWSTAHCEQFVRRCEELDCPQLALSVFGNHSKYGFDLSEKAARQLLHSLHMEHPLSETMTLIALYQVYKLPPVSNDLVASAMVASACFKAGTPEALTVAKALLPELEKLLKETDPKSMEYPTDWKERLQVKEKTWLTWSLNKIQTAMEKQDIPSGWLKEWREASGHTQVAA